MGTIGVPGRQTSTCCGISFLSSWNTLTLGYWVRRWLATVSVGRVVPTTAYSRKESMVSMTGFVRNLFTMRIDLTCSALVLSLFDKLAADHVG
jgi:hypothetical protein